MKKKSDTLLFKLAKALFEAGYNTGFINALRSSSQCPSTIQHKAGIQDNLKGFFNNKLTKKDESQLNELINQILNK